jgi:type IV pilus assembly protein PilB
MEKKLGPLLLQTGLITQQELSDSLEQARKGNVSLWDILIEKKGVSEDSLAETFAKWHKLPRVRIASASVQPEAVKTISEELARKHLCLPLQVELSEVQKPKGKGTLVVALANPADFEALRDIEFSSGMRARPVVATRTEILDAIAEHYATGERAQDFLANVADVTDFRMLPQEREEVDLDQLDLSAVHLPPVVKMCNLMVHDAIKAQASDVHIEPALNAVQVRMRVDGVLRDYMQVPKWLHNAVVSRLKILAKLDIADRRLPQDGRVRVQFQNKPLDIRISTLPTHFGEKVVLRILGSAQIPALKQMGLSEAQIPVVEATLNQPQGMILVTGPTGSGKSTTLYSMVEKRKSPEVNIVTVEDPIEYQVPGINQVQVNVKAGLSFANCLRSILRQDPDVILVGEIRDLETAEIAFQAAMTGHLVLSTLHTNSSLATLLRLLDLGVDPFLITVSVNLVIAQRLARRICLRCREQYTPSRGLLERLRIEEPTTVLYRGRGCSACGQTGYAGRVGIFELLRMTPTLKELVHRKANEGEMRKVAGLAGTRFLLEDAMEKVRQGITTLDEILRVIQLQEEEIIRCPKCNSFINLDFSTCPYCLYPLKYLCESCGQELKLEWRICPYCNTRTSRDVTGEGPKALPSAAEPEPAAAKAPRVPPGAAPGAMPEPKKPRILVVDDDEGIKKVIQKALMQLPIEVQVEAASDGEEALSKIEQNPPDMVILDVMMPRMDGLTTCQRLRGNVRTAFIPVMMLTASADESNRTKGYLVGTDDYMNKPFSVPDLHARVMRLLRRTYGL